MKHHCRVEKLQTKRTGGRLFIRCSECRRTVVGPISDHDSLSDEELLNAIRKYSRSGLAPRAKRDRLMQHLL